LRRLNLITETLSVVYLQPNFVLEIEGDFKVFYISA
jgi:hypothetical protein